MTASNDRPPHWIESWVGDAKQPDEGFDTHAAADRALHDLRFEGREAYLYSRDVKAEPGLRDFTKHALLNRGDYIGLTVVQYQPRPEWAGKDPLVFVCDSKVEGAAIATDGINAGYEVKTWEL